MTAKSRKDPKVTVKQNIWGNWNGYIGGRKVREFGINVGMIDSNEWVEDLKRSPGLARAILAAQPKFRSSFEKRLGLKPRSDEAVALLRELDGFLKVEALLARLDKEGT